MKLCYYHNTGGNFGDDLNAWLWPKFLPNLFDGTCKHGEEFYQQNDSEPAIFYGIGTILDERIPKKPIKFIAGSGTGYFPPHTIDSSYNIYFVRGPKTAERLGIDSSLAINDPAILLRELINKPERPDFPVSLIMHCDTAESGYWEKIAKNVGIHYIDPRTNDALKVIMDLISSEYVITESLHGAIIADAFGIPWLPITTMPNINDFKWQDWCHAIEVEYKPTQLISIFDDKKAKFYKRLINKGKTFVATNQLKNLLKDKKSFQSNENLINEQAQKMLKIIKQIQFDASQLAEK